MLPYKAACDDKRYREFVMAGTETDGLRAAIKHFPDSAREIEALFRDKENFRDICDELAAAEEALAAVERLDSAAWAERRLEWLCYVRGALAEIDAELRRDKVVPLNCRATASEGQA